MKKVFALAATAGLLLSLAACDWGSKKTDGPALNESATLNEDTGNASLGGNDLVVDDQLGNATGNTVDDGNATAATGNAL